MTKPIRVEHLQPCVDWWGGPGREGRVENEVTWRVGLAEVKARDYNLDFRNPHTVLAGHGNPVELLADLGEAEERADEIRLRLKAVLAEALTR